MEKKTFYQNSDKFGYSFIKNNIMFTYLLCIYKKSNILSLSKIDTWYIKLDHVYLNDFDIHKRIIVFNTRNTLQSKKYIPHILVILKSSNNSVKRT